MQKIETKLEGWSLPLVALFLTIYLPVVEFFISGTSAYFKFFAADTFYYLTIAGNGSWSNIASFDGINPTNGFHPLWQFLLKVIFNSFDVIDKAKQISITFWLSTSFVGLSAAILAYGLKDSEEIKPSSLILLALTPGILYFFIGMPNENYGHLWSFINGMESPLSLFLFAVLFYLMIKTELFCREPKIIDFLIIGALISLLVLSRLDDIFILIGLAIPFLWTTGSISQKIKKVAWLSFLPILSIGAYMIFNNHYAESYLPISGQAKGGLSFSSNMFYLLNAFVPILPLHESGWNWWNELTWRALHMFCPLVVSSAYLFIFIRRILIINSVKVITSFDSLLAGLAIYVILKATYNFLFVGIWHQGHWYYPLSIAVTNIIIIKFLSLVLSKINLDFDGLRFTSKTCKILLASLLIISLCICFYIFFGIRPTKEQFFGSNLLSYRFFLILLILSTFFLVSLALSSTEIAIRVSLSTTFAVALIVLSGHSILSTKEKMNYNNKYELLFENRTAIRLSLLEIDPNIRLLSFDDGIDAYSLGLPTMAGLGFALDRQAYEAKKQNNLLKIAYERGFKWLTTLVYMPDITAEVGSDVTNELSSVFWLDKSEAGKYQFALAYSDPLTGLKIIEFKLRK